MYVRFHYPYLNTAGGLSILNAMYVRTSTLAHTGFAAYVINSTIREYGDLITDRFEYKNKTMADILTTAILSTPFVSMAFGDIEFGERNSLRVPFFLMQV